MKKTLRNLMLAGAAALLATGASAQTLEKVWEKNSGVPGAAAGGEFRFMSCDKDGKILVTDKANKKIMTFNALFGAQDYLDIAPIIDEHYGVDVTKEVIDHIDTTVVEGVEVYDTIMKEETTRTVPGAGTLIASDDAGNILINTNFPSAGSGTDFIIIAANLKDSYKLQITMPEGVTAARCDQMGRIVGDMLSEEGAYMWICPNGATNVAIVKVVNGEQDMDYTQASTKCAVPVNTSCVAQPLYSTVEEIDALMDELGDLTPSFWFRNRSYPQNVYQWNEDATEQTAITLTETTEAGSTTKNASQEGFEVFTLQGETYFVLPMTTDGTTGGRSSNWGIYRASDQKLVASWEEATQKASSQFMGGFYVKPNDETSVYISHFLAGTVVGNYLFTVPKAEEPFEGPAELYMVGHDNNWDPANPTVIPMTETAGVYEAVLTFANKEFKFSEVKGTWDEFNAKAICIADDATVELDQATPLYKYAGSNCKANIATGKEYKVTIDLNANTITISESTAVEGIEVEEGEAVYYNLQGVKVANPENGVFIKVQGNKASKVLVK